MSDITTRFDQYNRLDSCWPTGGRLTARRQRELLDAMLVNRDPSSLPEKFALSAQNQLRKGSKRAAQPPKWLTSPLASLANPLVTRLETAQEPATADAPALTGRPKENQQH